MEELDPSQMRIADADRRRLADFLRAATVQGRLDADELEERLEATSAAKTYGDLVPIVLDLPGHGSVLEPDDSSVERYEGYTPDVSPRPEQEVEARPSGTPAPAGPDSKRDRTLVSFLSSQSRRGVWRVPENYNVVAVLGDARLDLRHATFESREVVINAGAVLGDVKIEVNERTQVIIDGVGILGDFREKRAKVIPVFDADSPVVRVKGVAMLGSVTVTRKRIR